MNNPRRRVVAALALGSMLAAATLPAAAQGFPTKPVRLIVPGWPGSLSSKWLKRILLRTTPHDGQGMGGTSYRVPVNPIVPGSNDDGKSFRDLTSMPVRSIITSPANGTRLPAGTREIILDPRNGRIVGTAVCAGKFVSEAATSGISVFGIGGAVAATVGAQLHRHQ